MPNKNFWIYRSSAGSGKTYTLTREYLTLAFKHPAYFRSILAVTFTNKATHEMKSRIMEQLNLLATGKCADQSLTSYLKKENAVNDHELAQRAIEILINLLHNYSHFSVTTIDSFFQKVIRSFSREVGLRGGFNIELDEAKVLDEIVDLLYEDLGSNKELTEWIFQFSYEKMEEGSAWDIRKDIKGLGREIFKEQYKKIANTAYPTEYTSAVNLLKEINNRAKTFERKLKMLAGDAITLMRRHNLTLEEFAYKKSSVPSYFWKIKDGNYKPGTRQVAGLKDVEVWTGKKNDQKERLTSIVESGLQPVLKECISYYENHKTEYCSLVEIRRFFYAFGIIQYLKSKLNEYRQEKEVMLISDASDFLQEVTRNNDTPFIYEKVGTRYQHFLIDEFQDTSSFQWENFRPLILNSLAEGKRNLVVGDVKQSIYRWRGGEWELLLHKIGSDVGRKYCREISLDQNWRSRKNLIHFNNSIFSNLPVVITAFLIEKNQEFEFLKNLPAAYQDAMQQLVQEQSAARDGGQVKVRFVEEDSASLKEESILKQLVEDLETLQQQGYQPKDVTILVRKSKQGVAIASHLMKYKESDQARPEFSYDIVTSEALLLDQSLAVRIIIQSMYCLSDPGNHLARVNLNYELNLLRSSGKDHHHVFRDSSAALEGELQSLRQLSLYDLVEKLIVYYQLNEQPGEFAYLQSFQDQVLKYSTNHSASIQQFLEWWEEVGRKSTVPMSEQINAFQIMTIHKSKGLQFKVVLIPFCDWKMDHDAFLGNILWCENRLNLKNNANALPLRYASALKNTIWIQEYLEEKVKAYIDNLNLLYVAFTRAIDQLIVYGSIKRYSSGLMRMETISDFLYVLVDPTQNQMQDLPKVWNSEKNEMIVGEAVDPLVKPQSNYQQATKLNTYFTSNWQEKIKIRRYRKDLFLLNSEAGSSINFGNLIHELLSRVVTIDDLDKVVKKAEIEGLLGKDDKDFVQQKFSQIKEDENVNWIFDREYQVKLEMPLLPTTGELKRPDRVMLAGDKVIVIDYKTGLEYGSNVKQVKDYVEIFKNMGYRNTSGFLLYLDNLKMERVI